jgi:hypothetical protein
MKKARLPNVVTQFKVNVAALLFTRAINTMERFQMASHTQTDTLSMFNDIILKLGGYTMFLQLKDCPWFTKNIEISQILQLKGDFGLLRYCKAFCEMKKQWIQNKYLQNYGRFEDSMFIAYTSAEMYHENGNNVGNTAWQKVICSGGKCLRFSEDKFPEVHEVFENFETYKQLLADVRYDSKLTTQQKVLGFIKKVWNSKAITLPGVIEMSKLQKELQDLGDLSHYKEFLSKFWFVTGQADDLVLEEQTKREIGLACGTSDTNLIYAHFKQQIHDWCKNSDEILTRESPFWKDIKKFHTAKG